MSVNWTKWGWGFLVIAATTGAAWEIFADRNNEASVSAKKKFVPVEDLLPAETVVYLTHVGGERHADAWKQTAAHEALTAAHIDQLVEKLGQFLKQQAPGTFDDRVEALANHLMAHGGSLSISVPPELPLPKATLVFHQAGKHLDLVSEIAGTLAEHNLKVETREIENRRVRIAHIVEVAGVDVAWWAEGGHLVVAAGVNPAESVIAVASGKRKNIREHRLFQEQTTAGDVAVTTKGFVDVRQLRERFGEFPVPIPEGKTPQVKDILQTVGLDNLEEFTFASGYEGKALWSETRLNTKGERKGLLSMFEGETITFDDLPPLPPKTNSFLATTIDPAKAYDTFRNVLTESLAYGPEDAAKQVNRQIDMIPNILGFDPKDDFLDGMGSLVVVCDDPDQGFFGTGGTVIVKVKDADKLRRFFEKVVDKLNSLAPNQEIAKIHRTKKQGREIWHFEFGQTFQGFGVGITEDWMVLAFVPQPVEAFFLRVDGKLPKWSKDQLAENGVPVVPESFSTFGVSNPKAIYQSALKVAPYAFSGLVVGLKEERVLPRNAVLPWTLADLPPAELIAGPLFPNVRTMTSDETGIRWTSRSSLPSLPLIGGPGSGNAPVAGSVIAGLALPAVQQAMVANKRSQSKNNLKQLGLAMHNYHDAYGALPAGTVPNEKLKPEERLSFFVETLPFVDQAVLFNKVDKEGGWEDKEHKEVMQTKIPVFINPGVREPETKPNYPPTHYVGIAGLGKDAPLLPVTSKRAGIFGYNRKTKFRDVTDGLSNTVMISEASKDYGPWGAGGNNSIRGLTKKRYINGPDGIGGPFPGGCHMLMGDGAVRFISQGINADTMEALVTIRGGEVVGAF